mmetsp:Transcript_21502/g.53321  ORF Transcript_21502/g.53321 Transcript_21502/m.53321 type:complete len:230 (-) Transcript_21502:288-977(-)
MNERSWNDSMMTTCHIGEKDKEDGSVLPDLSDKKHHNQSGGHCQRSRAISRSATTNGAFQSCKLSSGSVAHHIVLARGAKVENHCRGILGSSLQIDYLALVRDGQRFKVRTIDRQAPIFVNRALAAVVAVAVTRRAVSDKWRRQILSWSSNFLDKGNPVAVTSLWKLKVLDANIGINLGQTSIGQIHAYRTTEEIVLAGTSFVKIARQIESSLVLVISAAARALHSKIT